MTTRMDGITPESTANWPATPGPKRWEQAITTITMMEALGATTGFNITIPAHTTAEERPRDIITIEAPAGQATEFDLYHERRIDVPSHIILNAHKARNAQALHDCLQAVTFSQACADLFSAIRPSGPDETSWFVHTAADLGDLLISSSIHSTSPVSSTTTTVYLARSSLRRNCIWLNIASILQLQVPWVRTGSSSRPFQQTVVVVLVLQRRV